MKSESMDHQWRALSEEILFGLKAWREQHPKATLLEIEEEVSRQMSRLGAQVIQDAAQSSEASDWTSQPSTEPPRCPQCGTALVSRGKRRRRLQSSGGAQVELVRSYGTCPTCGVGLFPAFMRSWDCWRAP
jgi:RNase P subunit RPR2